MPSRALLPRPGAVSLVAQGGPNGYQYPTYQASCDACVEQSIFGCTAERCESTEVSGADIHSDNGAWCYCAPASGMVCGAGDVYNCYPSPSPPPPSPPRMAEAVLAAANVSTTANSSTSASSPAAASTSSTGAAAASPSQSATEWATAKAGELGRAVLDAAERSLGSLSASLGKARTRSPDDGGGRVRELVRLVNVNP